MVLKQLPNGKQFAFEKFPPHQPLVTAHSSATSRVRRWPTLTETKKMMEDRRSSVRLNEDFTLVAVNGEWNGVRERKEGFVND